jgi:hypothetical protein
MGLRRFVPGEPGQCLLPVPHLNWAGPVDKKTNKLAGAVSFVGCLGHSGHSQPHPFADAVKKDLAEIGMKVSSI